MIAKRLSNTDAVVSSVFLTEVGRSLYVKGKCGELKDEEGKVLGNSQCCGKRIDDSGKIGRQTTSLRITKAHRMHNILCSTNPVGSSVQQSP